MRWSARRRRPRGTRRQHDKGCYDIPLCKAASDGKLAAVRGLLAKPGADAVFVDEHDKDVWAALVVAAN